MIKYITLSLSIFFCVICANATVLVVDSLNNSGVGSLRTVANNASAFDTIRFNPNLIANGSDSIVLNSPIFIFKELTIIGLYTSTDTLFISGAGTTRCLMSSNNSFLGIDSLVIVNAHRYSNRPGAGISAQKVDSVSIKNSIIKNCAGGAVLMDYIKYGFDSVGDFSIGFFMNNCLISNNATNFGAAVEIEARSVNNPSSCEARSWVSNSIFKDNSSGAFICITSVTDSTTQTSKSFAEINNCDFLQNTTRPAVMCTGNTGLLIADSLSSSEAGLIVENCRFIGNNVSSYHGGGVHCSANSYTKSEARLLVKNSLFNSNNGISGAGCSVYGLSELEVLIDSCDFYNNSSLHTGGAVEVKGDIRMDTTHRNVKIQNSNFYNNTSGSYGGGIHFEFNHLGSGSLLDTIVVDRCSFWDNKSTNYSGGGICYRSNIGNVSDSNHFNVSRSSFFNNTGFLDGGAISLIHDFSAGKLDARITNSTFYKNTGVIAGGISSTNSNSLLKVGSSLFLDNVGTNGNFPSTNLVTLTSLGYNMVSDLTWASAGPFDLVNQDSSDLLLSPIGRNGGRTYTMMPAQSSIAIGNGNPNDLSHAQNVPINGIRDAGAAENCIRTFGSEVVVSCGSYTWSNGVTYYQSNNTAKDTLVNAAGCDSVISLNLVINPIDYSIDTISACGGYTWIDGITYTANNNVASHTLTNQFGCDSVVTLDLTILNSTFGIESVVSCDSYTWNGVTYTSSTNSPTDTLVNAVGCDSIVTLNLVINNSNQVTDVISACNSYTWINGQTYTSSNNTATMMYTNVYGCDSVVTLDLTINYTQYGTHVVSACESYLWNGVLYTSNNNSALDTLISSTGCDSIVTLDLTILQPTIGLEVVTSCGSFMWNGVTYTSDIYGPKDTLVSAVGCDSVVTLDLTILPISTGVETVIACDSYTWNGVTYTSSTNSPTDTLVNAVGCDSIVTLHLVINNSNQVTDVISACNSYTWINGQTYTSSNNTATMMYTNVYGCDSVVTLDLTINYTQYGTHVVSACESYLWNGILYTSNNNNALDTLVSSGGCDSIVTLDLTILPKSTGVETVVACDSYTWNNVTYTSSTTSATDTLVNSVGCDSIVTLNLTINNSSSYTDVVYSCGNYTWIDGIEYTASNNTASVVLINSVGCDSLVMLDLTIDIVDTSVVVNNLELTATALGADFQWIDCDADTMITGETKPKFFVTRSGNFAVEVTQFGCVDTSGCFSFINVDIPSIEATNSIQIYPNPTHDYINVKISNWPSNELEIVVRDIAGRLVSKESREMFSNQETFNINVSEWAKGTYFVEIGTGENKVIERVVVN